MAEAFVYCWTDHKAKMLYIGCHKGSLDDGYVCSSKHMMKEYEKRPNDFTRQIISEGENEDIRKLETKILQSVNARLNENFYNKHQNDGLYFDGWTRETITEEHKKNMSIAASKRKRTKEHIESLHNGRKDSKNTKEHNDAISKANKDKKHNIKSKINMSKSRLKRQDLKELASNAGKISQLKRKASGYYQSEEWKKICAKVWETRRKRKEGLVHGD